MIKAFRLSTSLLRTFSQHALTHLKIHPMDLVVNPLKLRKSIVFKNSPRWLHQDVKVLEQPPRFELTEAQLENICMVMEKNRHLPNPKGSLENFCSEVIKKLGVESFKQFIEFNMDNLDKLDSKTDFMHHVRCCSMLLNSNLILFNLFTLCNISTLTIRNVSRFLTKETLETDQKRREEYEEINKYLPKAKPVFDSYSRFAGKENNKVWEIPNQEASQASFQPFVVLDEIPVFEQESAEKAERSNWVYFQIEIANDELLTKDNVLKALKKLKVQPVKNVYIMNSTTKTDQNSPAATPKNETHEKSFFNLSKSNRASVKSPEEQDEALTFTESENMKNFHQKIEFCRQINKKNFAYGFVEFACYENKQKILNPVYGLFGIEFEKGFLVLLDADKKRTLRVNNMPWKFRPNDFVFWLNWAIQSKGLNMRFKPNPNYENYLSDSAYFFVKGRSFRESLSLLEIINSNSFNERSIEANFIRGGGRHINGTFVEDYTGRLSEIKQKKHIENRTRKRKSYYKRLSEMKRENNNKVIINND